MVFGFIYFVVKIKKLVELEGKIMIKLYFNQYLPYMIKHRIITQYSIRNF